MAAEKMNRRTQYTKSVIRQALLYLTTQQCFGSISVAQLCRRAQISRGTFYLHYTNITQVLNEVLEEIFQQIDEIPGNWLRNETAGEQCTYPMCQLLREHPEYHGLWMDDELSAYFVSRLIQTRGPAMKEALMKRTNLQEQELENLLWFQLSGCFAVSKRSLGCPAEQWCMSQRAIDCFIQGGIDALNQTANF